MWLSLKLVIFPVFPFSSYYSNNNAWIRCFPLVYWNFFPMMFYFSSWANSFLLTLMSIIQRNLSLFFIVIGSFTSLCFIIVFSSVQFSRSVVSDSLRPREQQHARRPCPSPTPGVYSNSCPLSQWCHPTISSSIVPFSSCLQSFPNSGSFQMSQLFSWGGPNIGVSASTSVLPMNTQVWFPLGWTGWISLQSKGLSRVFSNTTVQQHQFFGTQLSL